MIRLVLTCSACPEQYDAYLGDKMVGYLRLRHGHFTVDWPDVDGKVVYEAYPSGDGEFDSDEERDYYLRFAVDAIQRAEKDGYVRAMLTAPDVEYFIEGA